jgi:hypothetical protein
MLAVVTKKTDPLEYGISSLLTFIHTKNEYFFPIMHIMKQTIAHMRKHNMIAIILFSHARLYHIPYLEPRSAAKKIYLPEATLQGCRRKGPFLSAGLAR